MEEILAWENSAFRVRCWRQRGKCRPQYGIPSGTPYAGSGHWGFGCHNPADISIHAPRVGSDPRRAVYGKQPSHFNPRSPCGERHVTPSTTIASGRFQSTLPVWGATSETLYLIMLVRISIHAPRVGSDRGLMVPDWREEEFQSTLPVWGATRFRPSRWRIRAYFNPRSPCGERPAQLTYRVVHAVISIHAPRVGSDLLRLADRLHRGISIHAPRVGSDAASSVPKGEPGVISIHAPRVGSDLGSAARCPFPSGISIHAPRVGSDALISDLFHALSISIHAPRVGSDPLCFSPAALKLAFQSTLPVWGATPFLLSPPLYHNFNPRSPCGERRLLVV